MDEELGFVTLSDEDYAKGRFLLQGSITKILEPLRMYGQNDYVNQAIIELTKLAEDWGVYVRGDLSKPISVEYIRRVK
jgi:hypothetical protein